MYRVLTTWWTDGVGEFPAGDVRDLAELTPAQRANVVANEWAEVVDGDAPGLEPVAEPTPAEPAPESHPHAVGEPPLPGTWEYIWTHPDEANAAPEPAATPEEHD